MEFTGTRAGKAKAAALKDTAPIGAIALSITADRGACKSAKVFCHKDCMKAMEQRISPDSHVILMAFRVNTKKVASLQSAPGCVDAIHEHASSGVTSSASFLTAIFPKRASL
jgi:hypothetical protein